MISLPPAGVTIANPDMHIATLAEDGELEIEFTVERGRGYVPAQMNKQDNAEIGRIPVDSILLPGAQGELSRGSHSR